MILFVRHGERADQSQLQAERKAIEKYFDPHLTKIGAEQARLTGQYIKTLIQQHAERFQIKYEEIEPIILCSPFLRCMMTSRNIVEELDRIYKNTIFIQDELTEVMYSSDFDHDVLPKLHFRVTDFSQIDQKYLQMNQFQITKRFFEDNRFILPKCPESHKEIANRISAFTSTIMDICIQKTDFKKYPIICVTHQGVLDEAFDFLKVPSVYLDYCALLQIIFPKGNKEYEIPIRGENVWSKK